MRLETSTTDQQWTRSTLAATALLASAALSFGAVYWWAYLPGAGLVLALGCVTVRLHRLEALRAVATPFALVVLAIGIQLLPLRTDVLLALAPKAAAVASLVDVSFANNPDARHGLSVDTGATIRGLVFLLFTGTWVAICAAMLQRRDAASEIARNLVVVGGLLAVLGLAQQASFNGKLLWLWTPNFHATNTFGPFVNRNHFAGWMLLVLAVSIGYLAGHISTMATPERRSARERLLWLDSKSAFPVVLTAAAIAVMTCSILWTMSRSGIAATLVATLAMILAASRRLRARERKLIPAYLAFTLVALLAWRGTERLFTWYGNTTTLEWRIALWRDTLPALRDFWVTGSGFNTYGTVMLAYPRTDVTVFPREAHNDYLQFAVEGGLLVGVPVLILVGVVIWQIVRRLNQPQDQMTWWIRMGAVAALCGITVQEVSEFSLQIPAVALMFATCVAIALHEPSVAVTRPRSRSTSRRVLVTSLEQ